MKTIEEIKTITEYVAWRAEWRILYKEISETLRNSKKHVKEDMRAGRPCGLGQWNLLRGKEVATKLLVARQLAKEKAIEIWNLAAKEKGAV